MTREIQQEIVTPALKRKTYTVQKDDQRLSAQILAKAKDQSRFGQCDSNESKRESARLGESSGEILETIMGTHSPGCTVQSTRDKKHTKIVRRHWTLLEERANESI